MPVRVNDGWHLGQQGEVVEEYEESGVSYVVLKIDHAYIHTPKDTIEEIQE